MYYNKRAFVAIAEQIASLRESEQASDVTRLSQLPSSLASASAADRSKYEKQHLKARKLQEQIEQTETDIEHLQKVNAIVQPIIEAHEGVKGYADTVKKSIKVW